MEVVRRPVRAVHHEEPRLLKGSGLGRLTGGRLHHHPSSARRTAPTLAVSSTRDQCTAWYVVVRSAADVGVVNRLARRVQLLPGSELYGKAFESWVFHELSAWASYQEFEGGLAYWRLAGGTEVDFVLGDMEVAIEAKSSERIHRDHLKGLRSLAEDHPGVRRRVVVCRESKARITNDGIEILPVGDFVRRLWSGELVSRYGR